MGFEKFSVPLFLLACNFLCKVSFPYQCGVFDNHEVQFFFFFSFERQDQRVVFFLYQISDEAVGIIVTSSCFSPMLWL
jgi:hypothetical protein